MTLVNEVELSLGLVVDPPRRAHADYAGVEVQSGPWPKPIFLCLPQEERRFVTQDSNATIAWSNGPLCNPKPLQGGEHVVFIAVEGSTPHWGRAEELFRAQIRTVADMLRIVSESGEVVWSGSYSDRHNSRHDNHGALPRMFDERMSIQQYDRSSSSWDYITAQEEMWCRLAQVNTYH